VKLTVTRETDFSLLGIRNGLSALSANFPAAASESSAAAVDNAAHEAEQLLRIKMNGSANEALESSYRGAVKSVTALLQQ
jgi:hypothetical protein